MRKIRVILRFRECEHNGDLDAYASDVVKCGGIVLDRMVDPLAEKGYLTVKLNCHDPEEFYRKFRKTSSYDFLF